MLLYILTVVFSVFANAATGIFGAFLIGVWYDVWHGRVLGTTSLLLVVLSLLVNGYKRKFTAKTVWFLVPFTLVSVTAADMVVHRRVGVPTDIEYHGFVVGATLGFYAVFSVVWHRYFTQKKLSV